MLAVYVHGLRKFYGDFKALKGIFFTVNEGEIFGLIESNGSGETTTLGILATILKPSHGGIRILSLDDVVKEAGKIRG